MYKYCIICGKKLKNSIDPIGPVCAKKIAYSVPKKKYKINISFYHKQLSQYDIFSEDITENKSMEILK